VRWNPQNSTFATVAREVNPGLSAPHAGTMTELHPVGFRAASGGFGHARAPRYLRVLPYSTLCRRR
jgi:hypothetical protein